MLDLIVQVLSGFVGLIGIAALACAVMVNDA